jgi:hypothetical protein
MPSTPWSPVAANPNDSTDYRLAALAADETSALGVALREAVGPGFDVNVVAATGATETIPATHTMHSITMDENCTFTFPTVTGGFSFLLELSGAFTPTFPGTVDWSGGTPVTYGSPTVYRFSTFDGGTTWRGSAYGTSFA